MPTKRSVRTKRSSWPSLGDIAGTRIYKVLRKAFAILLCVVVLVESFSSGTSLITPPGPMFKFVIGGVGIVGSLLFSLDVVFADKKPVYARLLWILMVSLFGWCVAQSLSGLVANHWYFNDSQADFVKATYPIEYMDSGVSGHSGLIWYRLHISPDASGRDLAIKINESQYRALESNLSNQCANIEVRRSVDGAVQVHYNFLFFTVDGPVELKPCH